MLDPVATLELAEQVAAAARSLGFETALIGAAALAVHGYTRGTEDIDLACAVNPEGLGRLERMLIDAGLQTRLNYPDDDDPLSGMLTVWATEDADGVPVGTVDLVNFPQSSHTPACAAIERAEPLPGSALRCVGIADLIALKLYAGGLVDHADIVQLLLNSRSADLSMVRSVASPFGVGGILEALIQQAELSQRGARMR